MARSFFPAESARCVSGRMTVMTFSTDGNHRYTVTSSSRNRPRSCCISPTNIARRGFCQPACRKERRSIRWVMFAVTELEQPLWRISKHTALYPEDKRLPADIVLAKEEFLAMAAILDSHLEGRRFIVGDSVTVADCVTAYLVDWANEFHLIDDFGQLQAYLQRKRSQSRGRVMWSRSAPGQGRRRQVILCRYSSPRSTEEGR
jgi:hypothetical protein